MSLASSYHGPQGQPGIPENSSLEITLPSKLGEPPLARARPLESPRSGNSIPSSGGKVGAGSTSPPAPELSTNTSSRDQVCEFGCSSVRLTKFFGLTQSDFYRCDRIRFDHATRQLSFDLIADCEWTETVRYTIPDEVQPAALSPVATVVSESKHKGPASNQCCTHHHHCIICSRVIASKQAAKSPRAPSESGSSTPVSATPPKPNHELPTPSGASVSAASMPASSSPVLATKSALTTEEQPALVPEAKEFVSRTRTESLETETIMPEALTHGGSRMAGDAGTSVAKTGILPSSEPVTENAIEDPKPVDSVTQFTHTSITPVDKRDDGLMSFLLAPLRTTFTETIRTAVWLQAIMQDLREQAREVWKLGWNELLLLAVSDEDFSVEPSRNYSEQTYIRELRAALRRYEENPKLKADRTYAARVAQALALERACLLFRAAQRQRDLSAWRTKILQLATSLLRRTSSNVFVLEGDRTGFIPAKEGIAVYNGWDDVSCVSSSNSYSFVSNLSRHLQLSKNTMYLPPLASQLLGTWLSKCYSRSRPLPKLAGYLSLARQSLKVAHGVAPLAGLADGVENCNSQPVGLCGWICSVECGLVCSECVITTSPLVVLSQIKRLKRNEAPGMRACDLSTPIDPMTCALSASDELFEVSFDQEDMQLLQEHALLQDDEDIFDKFKDRSIDPPNSNSNVDASSKSQTSSDFDQILNLIYRTDEVYVSSKGLSSSGDVSESRSSAPSWFQQWDGNTVSYLESFRQSLRQAIRIMTGKNLQEKPLPYNDRRASSGTQGRKSLSLNVSDAILSRSRARRQRGAKVVAFRTDGQVDPAPSEFDTSAPIVVDDYTAGEAKQQRVVNSTCHQVPDGGTAEVISWHIEEHGDEPSGTKSVRAVVLRRCTRVKRVTIDYDDVVGVNFQISLNSPAEFSLSFRRRTPPAFLSVITDPFNQLLVGYTVACWSFLDLYLLGTAALILMFIVLIREFLVDRARFIVQARSDPRLLVTDAFSVVFRFKSAMLPSFMDLQNALMMGLGHSGDPLHPGPLTASTAFATNQGSPNEPQILTKWNELQGSLAFTHTKTGPEADIASSHPELRESTESGRVDPLLTSVSLAKVPMTPSPPGRTTLHGPPGPAMPSGSPVPSEVRSDVVTAPTISISPVLELKSPASPPVLITRNRSGSEANKDYIGKSPPGDSAHQRRVSIGTDPARDGRTQDGSLLKHDVFDLSNLSGLDIESLSTPSGGSQTPILLSRSAPIQQPIGGEHETSTDATEPSDGVVSYLPSERSEGDDLNLSEISSTSQNQHNSVAQELFVAGSSFGSRTVDLGLALARGDDVAGFSSSIQDQISSKESAKNMPAARESGPTNQDNSSGGRLDGSYKESYSRQGSSDPPDDLNVVVRGGAEASTTLAHTATFDEKVATNRYHPGANPKETLRQVVGVTHGQKALQVAPSAPRCKREPTQTELFEMLLNHTLLPLRSAGRHCLLKKCNIRTRFDDLESPPVLESACMPKDVVVFNCKDARPAPRPTDRKPMLWAALDLALVHRLCPLQGFASWRKASASDVWIAKEAMIQIGSKEVERKLGHDQAELCVRVPRNSVIKLIALESRRASEHIHSKVKHLGPRSLLDFVRLTAEADDVPSRGDRIEVRSRGDVASPTHMSINSTDGFLGTPPESANSEHLVSLQSREGVHEGGQPSWRNRLWRTAIKVGSSVSKLIRILFSSDSGSNVGMTLPDQHPDAVLGLDDDRRQVSDSPISHEQAIHGTKSSSKTEGKAWSAFASFAANATSNYSDWLTLARETEGTEPARILDPNLVEGSKDSLFFIAPRDVTKRLCDLRQDAVSRGASELLFELCGRNETTVRKKLARTRRVLSEPIRLGIRSAASQIEQLQQSMIKLASRRRSLADRSPSKSTVVQIQRLKAQEANSMRSIRQQLVRRELWSALDQLLTAPWLLCRMTQENNGASAIQRPEEQSNQGSNHGLALQSSASSGDERDGVGLSLSPPSSPSLKSFSGLISSPDSPSESPLAPSGRPQVFVSARRSQNASRGRELPAGVMNVDEPSFRGSASSPERTPFLPSIARLSSTPGVALQRARMLSRRASMMSLHTPQSNRVDPEMESLAQDEGKSHIWESVVHMGSKMWVTLSNAIWNRSSPRSQPVSSELPMPARRGSSSHGQDRLSHSPLNSHSSPLHSAPANTGFWQDPPSIKPSLVQSSPSGSDTNCASSTVASQASLSFATPHRVQGGAPNKVALPSESQRVFFVPKSERLGPTLAQVEPEFLELDAEPGSTEATDGPLHEQRRNSVLPTRTVLPLLAKDIRVQVPATVYDVFVSNLPHLYPPTGASAVHSRYDFTRPLPIDPGTPAARSAMKTQFIRVPMFLDNAAVDHICRIILPARAFNSPAVRYLSKFALPVLYIYQAAAALMGGVLPAVLFAISRLLNHYFAAELTIIHGMFRVFVVPFEWALRLSIYPIVPLIRGVLTFSWHMTVMTTRLLTYPLWLLSEYLSDVLETTREYARAMVSYQELIRLREQFTFIQAWVGTFGESGLEMLRRMYFLIEPAITVATKFQERIRHEWHQLSQGQLQAVQTQTITLLNRTQNAILTVVTKVSAAYDKSKKDIATDIVVKETAKVSKGQPPQPKAPTHPPTTSNASQVSSTITLSAVVSPKAATTKVASQASTQQHPNAGDGRQTTKVNVASSKLEQDMDLPSPTRSRSEM